MRKVLVLYGTYGGGHLSAAKAIKKEIEENYDNVDCMMIDCIEYIDKYFNKATTTLYKELAKKAPLLWKTTYDIAKKGIAARLNTDNNKLMSFKLLKLIEEYKPDLIINTHPFGSTMCGFLKKLNKIDVRIATILTDFHIHPQWLVYGDYVDYFFVSNEQMRDDMVEAGIDSGKITVSGIPVNEKFLEKFDRKKICSKIGLDPNKEVVLFFAGGEFGLGRSMTLKVLDTLINVSNELQVVAISGRNPKMYGTFNNIVEKENAGNRIKVLEFTDKVPELMSISKFVITKAGGLTLTESLTSGLPIIIINPIPGQEEENAEFLVDNGVAIWIKKGDNVKEIFENLSLEKLKYMKDNTKKLAKPHSTHEICKKVLEDLKYTN